MGTHRRAYKVQQDSRFQASALRTQGLGIRRVSGPCYTLFGGTGLRALGLQGGAYSCRATSFRVWFGFFGLLGSWALFCTGSGSFSRSAD